MHEWSAVTHASQPTMIRGDISDSPFTTTHTFGADSNGQEISRGDGGSGREQPLIAEEVGEREGQRGNVLDLDAATAADQVRWPFCWNVELYVLYVLFGQACACVFD